MNLFKLEPLKNKLDTMENFSGVISVKKDSELLFEKCVGYAEIANKRENNINTRFGVASGAKLLTAIAICKLVQDKKISFETLVRDYINFDNIDDTVAIKHLLSHTSGLPDYFDEEVMSHFSELWIKNPMYLMKEPKDLYDEDELIMKFVI